MESNNENNENNEDDSSNAQASINAFSRALAVMILMFLPGIIGNYLDRWLGTKFLTMIGFVLGITIAIFGLLYIAKVADLRAKQNRERKSRTED